MKIFRILALTILAILAFVQALPARAEGIAVESHTLSVEGQTFRYLKAGSVGPAIVLLHGWPQNADEFRKVLPLLAKTYRVYAPDLSGIGGSTAPRQDWRKQALAQDIGKFIGALGLKKPVIAGHDIGGMVAYAYARQFPDAVSGIAVLDVPIPGLDPWDDIAGSMHAWHFAFHNQKGLAETLVEGRQAAYFRYFINRNAGNSRAISDNDIAVFAKAYGTPEKLRAGFEFYRAFEKDAKFFKSRNETLAVPMLLVGGEYSMKATLPVMTQSFARAGATNVTAVAIAGAGHWLAEEQPQALAVALSDFAARLRDR